VSKRRQRFKTLKVRTGIKRNEIRNNYGLEESRMYTRGGYI
jgi:hypothetical protein